jgi:adenylylsulfate kinase-like enzyme
MIILLFGQPASGKTTLANSIFTMPSLFYGIQEFIKIDGDKWRGVTKNKDYSREGRINNLKGAFDMALYLENEGYTPIISMVTPYEEMRNYLLEKAKIFCPIYLHYNENRGRNDFFAKDWEEPKLQCLNIDTSLYSVQECLGKIINYISIKYDS